MKGYMYGSTHAKFEISIRLLEAAISMKETSALTALSSIAPAIGNY